MKKTLVLTVSAIFIASTAFAQFLPEPRPPVNTFAPVERTAPREQKAFPLASLLSIDIPAAYDTFEIGEQVQSLSAPRYIPPFKINRFETTYQLWYEVRLIAENMGYEFQNPGQEGSGGRRGRVPTEAGRYEPVTAINWRDAIIWCNAFSEIQNLTPVYTYQGQVLRSSRNAARCDLAECNWKANGYRLPSEAEWEYAARKKPDGSFQKGNLASGQIEDAENPANTVSISAVAWCDQNTSGTKTVATAGTQSGSIADAGKGQANSLGIYDMSGNVLEFCWDWAADYDIIAEGEFYTGPSFGYQRISRGGSWSPYASYLLCGDRYAYDSDEAYNYMGFRFAQTISPVKKAATE